MLASPDFFVREVNGVTRNVLWERFLHLNSLRGVEYLAPRDVPFDIVCGYIHGRSRSPGVPLVFTGEISQFLSARPFSFEYFNGSRLSVFMLADFAADFSRLSCIRDREQVLREATFIFDAYLDHNVRFAEASMGEAYTLLCEIDPHERDGFVMSNFLATGYQRAKSEAWVDADLGSVAGYVAHVAARLVAHQGSLSVIPECWYPCVRRGLERAALMHPLLVPQFGGESDARERVSAGIRHLSRAYGEATASGTADVVPADLGASAPSLNVLTLAGGSGLSANGRMIWREITKTFCARLIEIDFGRSRIRRVAAEAGLRPGGARSVNVFAFNGDLITHASSLNPAVCRRGAYNIGFLLWETSCPPETYMNGVLLLDEIWVPSSYLEDVFRSLVPQAVHVVNVGKHIESMPGQTYGVRELFHIEPAATVFLAIGDFGSSLARKNIEAAVDAFQAANPARSEAVLIVKIRQIDRRHWSNQSGLWERIERKIRADDRIHVLQGNLSAAEYWGVLNDCDCIVSLHRSEGFGYGIAHCHSLGKASIVSDYSGVRDFCTEATAHLVPCREVAVNPIDMNCREAIGVWGEPDVDAAAAAIREVAAAGPGPSRMGEAAQELFRTLYGGSRFRRIIEGRLKRALQIEA